MKTAKEISLISIFLAIILTSQVALSAFPNIEVVTLFCTLFFYLFGVKRGLILAVAFSFIRCIIFGFYPTVIILYLVYYSLFALVVGLMGDKFNHKYTFKRHIVLIITVCFLSCVFTLLDDIITPLFYGLYNEAFYSYFIASLPFMLSSVLCTLVSISLIFPFFIKITEKINIFNQVD